MTNTEVEEGDNRELSNDCRKLISKGGISDIKLVKKSGNVKEWYRVPNAITKTADGKLVWFRKWNRYCGIKSHYY